MFQSLPCESWPHVIDLRLKRTRREACGGKEAFPANGPFLEKSCFIYCFSFALHPEDPTPSGSCNMSRIDHVDLSLQLQEGLGKEQVTVIVFARNFNILRFREGLGGLAYAN